MARARQAAWETAYKKGEAALNGLSKRKEALEQELNSLVSEIRTRYPRYGALKYPRPFPASELSLRTNEADLLLSDEATCAEDRPAAQVVRPSTGVDQVRASWRQRVTHRVEASGWRVARRQFDC